MQSKTINHKRITQVVRNVIGYRVDRAESHALNMKHDPEGVEAKAYKEVLPGISFDDRSGIRKVFVTVNDEFLGLVGYDGNLSGFLADYFGDDYKPGKGEPLKFRFLEGYLINPTKIEKGQKK